MNEKKDSVSYHNVSILLYIHFIYQSSRSVRRRYELNTHAITIFVSCYLYYISVNSLFTITGIFKYLGVYDYKRMKKYFLILVNKNMITLRGSNKYTLTDIGLSAIQEIVSNSERLIYEFCQKYGIEL